MFSSWWVPCSSLSKYNAWHDWIFKYANFHPNSITAFSKKNASWRNRYLSYIKYHTFISARPKNYQHIVSLVFAVKEINENQKILPNVSLGFHIYDGYTNAGMTHQNTMKLLSTSERIVPNFKCDKKKKVIAVIGGLYSDISLHMATVLGIYKIPQVECILWNLSLVLFH